MVHLRVSTQRVNILKDPLVSKFVNIIMKDGKKTKAEKIVSTTFLNIKQRTQKDPVAVLGEAIETAKPMVDLMTIRLGATRYRIPVTMTERRQQFFAMKWLVNGARSKKGRPMADKLTDELLEAVENRGEAVRLRDEHHKTASSNAQFAHFKWRK